MEDSRWKIPVLLDFYGELLTGRQRQCCELYYNEDLSLAEIAEQSGISRQGVWDNIRRGEAALEEYEEKTGLAGRFSRQRELAGALREKLEQLRALSQGRARELAEEALGAVDALME